MLLALPMNPDIEVRALERATFAEYWLTASPGEPEEVFRRIAAVLAEKGVQPVQEKVYAAGEVREVALAARAAALRQRGLDPSLPLTCLDGRPVTCGAPLAGVQIWGVSRKPVSSVQGGRLWSIDGARFLCLPCVRGDASPSAARRMFENADTALRANGFGLKHVARTWIYLPRLLDWYGEFNGVRNAHYRKAGLEAFPASSGVQGRSGDDECFMDVLAVDGVKVAPILRSSRQNSPVPYGSAFSRAVSLEFQGRRTIHISGTASIDGAGHTLHVSDPEAQSVEALLNVGALLGDQGGGLCDIVSATVFCKNEAARESFARVRRLLAVPDFPTLYVQADICRADLLVEMEAVAVL